MGSKVSVIRTKVAMVPDEERCCGGCCWFKFEETDGWGQCCCPDGECILGVTHCSDFCTGARYVGIDEKRRHLAVLRKFQRCLSQVVKNKDVDVKSVCDSLDFVIGYCKEV